MSDRVVRLYLSDTKIHQQWQHFLQGLAIPTFSSQEVTTLDETWGLLDDQDQLVGTGSLAGSTIKYVGVCNREQTPGARFNQILSVLINRLAEQSIFHAMVFTKPDYQTSFEHIGFQILAASSQGVLLEKGLPNLEDYLEGIAQPPASVKDIAAIVMNANPFTNGHRYLVEQAAREHDWVYVFVVATNRSLFTTAERYKLVKAGTADLNNVTVVSGGQYMVSYATFPAYFIQSADEAIRYQTTLDARLFAQKVAPALGITTRYLGSEPLSHTTGIYNTVLQRELPPAVAVKIVERKTDEQGDWITATAVRRAIADHNVPLIKANVPDTTYSFLQAHLVDLQDRIEKGMKISGN